MGVTKKYDGKRGGLASFLLQFVLAVSTIDCSCLHIHKGQSCPWSVFLLVPPYSALFDMVVVAGYEAQEVIIIPIAFSFCLEMNCSTICAAGRGWTLDVVEHIFQ